ncbi:hypothetical protein [Psychrobacillus lasiicapitis]|uniref:hypothetical protein n=1 Tax=Psychrobacillus lasiicapitis TaxID=1636719 RepID=UPI0019908778|nr:hypothetical protein GCM10011384_01020 [Psychrobacillus lasiicapitis]
MKMKKYTADTMPEAMKLIRKELGEEAVILSSKVVYSKGFLGLFKKKSIEVLAGMDSMESPEPSLEKPAIQQVQEDLHSIAIKKELEDLKQMVKTIGRQQPNRTYPDELEALIHHSRSKN